MSTAIMGELRGATFEAAIPVVLQHEGGFVDDPADAGGATRYGISLRFLEDIGVDVDRDGDIDAADVRALTLDQAVALYRERFWDANEYDRFAHQELATKVFDLAVNMGPRQAHRLLQRASRAAGIFLKDDGLLGPRTWRAVRTHESGGTSQALLAALRSEAAGFYRVLAAKRPVNRRFLDGWIRRAYH